MFKKISSVLRSSQLITETARATQWVQSDKDEHWLDGVNLSQIRGGAAKSPHPSALSVCWMWCTCPTCLEYRNLQRYLFTFKFIKMGKPRLHLTIYQLLCVRLGSWAKCGKLQCSRAQRPVEHISEDLSAAGSAEGWPLRGWEVMNWLQKMRKNKNN